MHLRLFEWFTSEWADLAPYVVGGPLLPLVRGLPAGVCIKDHFGARGDSHWPPVLSSLLDIRRDFDAAVSDYDREFDYFASCLGDLRAARADLCEFIAVFTIAPDVGGLAIRTGRLLYAYAMHASALRRVGVLFLRRFDLHARLAGMFGAGDVLTGHWLGGEEAEQLLELLEEP